MAAGARVCNNLCKSFNVADNVSHQISRPCDKGTTRPGVEGIRRRKNDECKKSCLLVGQFEFYLTEFVLLSMLI